MKIKTAKCHQCERVCKWDEKWQKFFHAYYLDELLSGKTICKITFFDSPEKSLSDARLKAANAAWEEVGI